MSARSGLHPEHAIEQAYIEEVYRAEEARGERAKRAPEAAADKYAARKAREAMLERWGRSIDPESLCFARVDFQDDKTHYLGRGAVWDDDNNLLVVDWRRPVVKPFYTASPHDPQGLRRRRRFQLSDLKLLGIVDDTFGDGGRRPPTDAAGEPVRPRRPVAAPGPPQQSPQDEGPPAAPEEAPHVVDAILAEMDRARGAEMRDIVATIEAQQYDLISDSIDGVLTIQGGPGSGKTAIALHRAAWLLYNHREELERSGVLVVGPNRAFMEYVSQVLPSLGEASVVQASVDRLPDLTDVRVRETEGVEVARLKGEIRMAQVVRRAVFARVRLPQQDVELEVGRSRHVLPKDDVLRLARDAWRGARTYLGARDAFRRALVASAQAQVLSSRRRFVSGPTADDIERAVTASGGPLEQVWPTVTAPEVIRDLLNSRRRLEAAAEEWLSADERTALLRERTRLLREEPWTAADIPLLDEADAMLRGVSRTYGYVLADEAQDLSPMQLRMIFRRSGANRATLVGDIAQATGPTRLADWTDLFEAAAIDAELRIAELRIGYRVPRQIMALAAQLLPRVAPDIVVPTAVREGPEDPRLLTVDEGNFAETLVTEVARRVEGERSVGVIGPPGELDRLRAVLTEGGLDPGDVLTDGLTRQVTVLSAHQAKGLEFDHVVVVEPAAIAGSPAGWAYVYIALTRATRTLSVIHSTPDPFEIPEPERQPEVPIESAPVAIDDLPPVANAPTGTVLGARYTEALMQAKFLHSGQHRRGTLIPYLAHLQAVAALVLEDGGSEDEGIAALLHDAVEDNGPQVLDQIVEQFGVAVARIVAGCTDPHEAPGVTWRERKIEHLRALESAGPQVRRVALAEKLDNARALLRDYRRLEGRLWARMEVDPEDLLWYFASLADLFVTERPGDMASEFQDTVNRLLDLASTPVA